MPLTPFHLGIGLVLGMIFYRWIDFPTICIGTMIVDLRSIFIFLGPFEGALHGPLHTFLGGTLLAVGLGAVMYTTKPAWNWVGEIFGLAQERSVYRVGIASLLGVYTHLFLDALMHSDMRPFYPIHGNPLSGHAAVGDIYLICVAGFLIGSVLYMVHVYRWRTGQFPE